MRGPPAEVKMRKYGGRDACLTISPGTDRDGEALRPSLLSDFCSSERSGVCAQLHVGNHMNLWVGRVLSSLRRSEKGKALCPFCPLRNSCERSGLPGENLAGILSQALPPSLHQHFGDMKG